MSTTTAGGNQLDQYSSVKKDCHCKHCGNTDLCFRGDWAWDVERQSFKALETDSDEWAWCHDCDTEVEIVFKPITT